jgi:DNA-binding beta-propeller fold protein YncE
LEGASLAAPYEIAVDKKGLIYVSQLRREYIAVFENENGRLIKKIPDDREARLLDLSIMPGRFCLNEAKGNIYVIDRNSFQIYVFDLLSGGYLFQFGGKGEGKGKFSMISGIASDEDGRIYVSDAIGIAVQVFDASGNFLYGFGKHGPHKENFSHPSSLIVRENIWIADTLRQQIKLFSKDGKPLNMFGRFGTGDGSLYFPVDIDIDL